MKNDQHIKSFFKFIEKKEKRNIPFSIKFTLFDDELTKQEIGIFKYGLDSQTRADLFNKKIKKKYFFNAVMDFSRYSPSVTLAYSREGPMFIDINGNKTVEGIDLSKIKKTGNISDLHEYNAYINSIQDTFSYHGLETHGNLLIANITLFKGHDRIHHTADMIFHQRININKNGYPDPDFNIETDFQKIVHHNTVAFLYEIQLRNKLAGK